MWKNPDISLFGDSVIKVVDETCHSGVAALTKLWGDVTNRP